MWIIPAYWITKSESQVYYNKVFQSVCYVWLQKGTKAPQAAGKIHTDFEKGFIMAEVMKYDDFKEEGSEAAAKVSTQLFLTRSSKDGRQIQHSNILLLIDKWEPQFV